MNLKYVYLSAENRLATLVLVAQNAPNTLFSQRFKGRAPNLLLSMDKGHYCVSVTTTNSCPPLHNIYIYINTIILKKIQSSKQRMFRVKGSVFITNMNVVNTSEVIFLLLIRFSENKLNETTKVLVFSLIFHIFFIILSFWNATNYWLNTSQSGM